MHGIPEPNDLTSPWDYERFREGYRAAYGHYPDHDPAHDYLLDQPTEKAMHYRNGREAKNGDRVVSFGNGGGSKIEAVGVLQNAVPGNDYCNGDVLVRPPHGTAALLFPACLCDCLHAEDVEGYLRAVGLDKRPAGK